MGLCASDFASVKSSILKINVQLLCMSQKTAAFLYLCI